jgi:hypothetical protein
MNLNKLYTLSSLYYTFLNMLTSYPVKQVNVQPCHFKMQLFAVDFKPMSSVTSLILIPTT